MLKRHLKTIVFVAFISCSSHNKKNTGNSDSRAANNFTNPLFPNPQVYPTKNQIEEAYRYVCHNGLHTRPLNTFESTKYVIDGSQYMPNTGKEKEAILHVEPVLNESMSNKGASTTLSYLLFEKRIKATIRYNPSKGEYETDPNLIALNVSPETVEWKNKVLGNLPWVSGFVFSEILSPPFVDENIAQIFEKAPGHLPHTQMVMGILAEHSPESPIISFDHRSDEEWKEFSRLKYIKKLTDDEIVFWRSKFQRRAAAFSRVLDKLNIGYINISMGLMDRNLMGRDSLKTEFEVMGPFLEALLNPSRAVVFQASPEGVSASDHVDLSSSYINRLQVVGFSTEDSKKQTYKDGTKRDIIVNTGDIHDLENKRCYLYTEDCSIGGGDNPGSSFSTPLAVSIAVWLRETQFASEPWSPELVQKIITALKTQAIWYPLHEGQTMGHHLGYISPWVSDWQRLNDLGYPHFNSWEEACRYFKHPNFKSVEDLEKMIEEQQHRQNPNFKSVEDLKKMVGE